MHIALIDNEPTQAAPGLKGWCPGCGQVVVAKCGAQRMHHWAHQKNRMCDSWWEQETEWHRSWKNSFPNEWQEVFLPDEQTGEKHIADVRTSEFTAIRYLEEKTFGARLLQEGSMDFNCLLLSMPMAKLSG